MITFESEVKSFYEKIHVCNNQHNMAKKGSTTRLRKNFCMVKKKSTTRLKRNFSVLKAIGSSKPCNQKAIVQALSDDCVCCLCDCSRNILNGNVKLTVHHKKNLSHFHDALRDLAHRYGPIGTKKHIIINQKGEFLGFLVKPVLSVLNVLFGGAA